MACHRNKVDIKKLQKEKVDGEVKKAEKMKERECNGYKK